MTRTIVAICVAALIAGCSSTGAAPKLIASPNSTMLFDWQEDPAGDDKVGR